MYVASAPRLTKAARERLTEPRLDDPEVTLMLRVQRDDKAAYTELVGRYWSQVSARIYRQMCDREEAEDLAQEVFLRLYRHRKRYQPRAKFATWIYHITQNVMRNALRTKRRHPCRRIDMTAWSPATDSLNDCPLADKHEPPTQPLEREELCNVVRSAVGELAGRQRKALELHQFQNRSYAEVASAMKMTAKAAKSLLYRARNQLRVDLAWYEQAGT